MIQSLRLSQMVLRIGLAIVFFWLGAQVFFHPPEAQLLYLIGVFEVLVGLSFLTGVLMNVFAMFGALLLVIFAISSGVTDVAVRDIGIIGGLLAITLWPERI